MRSLIMALSALSLICSCSEKKSFKGGVSQGQTKKVEPDAPAPKLVEKSQDFDVSKTSTGAIDMFWVIDNSGSMQEEAAQVRKNFDKFMASVSAEVDLRVTVISNKNPRFGVALSADATAKGHMQIDQEVGSTNLLTLAASSLCDPSQTHVPAFDALAPFDNWGDFKICGKTGNFEEARGFYGAQEIAGNAIERLRPNASKVFVFVTDDNVEGLITTDNFFEVIKLDPATAHVYAFRGEQDTASCQISRAGEAYDSLAVTTKGESFDICLDDWSPYFDKLTSSVVAIAKNGFTILSSGDVTIKKVLLDGVELPASAYSYANKTVKILDQAKLDAAKTLRVVYVEN